MDFSAKNAFVDLPYDENESELCQGARRIQSRRTAVQANLRQLRIGDPIGEAHGRKEVMRRAGEWDWAVFGRTGIDLADDWRLALEAGHQWYVYGGVKPDYVDVYHTMEEWFGRVALENPFVTPYFEYFYDHKVYEGAFMQGGLRHQFELPFGLLLTPDLTIGGGDANYNACMYPPFDGSVAGGITYVQLMGTLQYWFNDHFGVHARVAYVSLVNGDIRDAVDEYGSPYANDHVWGTIGVDVAF